MAAFLLYLLVPGRDMPRTVSCNIHPTLLPPTILVTDHHNPYHTPQLIDSLKWLTRKLKKKGQGVDMVSKRRCRNVYKSVEHFWPFELDRLSLQVIFRRTTDGRRRQRQRTTDGGRRTTGRTTLDARLYKRRTDGRRPTNDERRRANNDDDGIDENNFIYIYIYRERETCIRTDVCVYIYLFIMPPRQNIHNVTSSLCNVGILNGSGSIDSYISINIYIYIYIYICRFLFWRIRLETVDMGRIN